MLRGTIITDSVYVHANGPTGEKIGALKRGEIVHVLRTYRGLTSDWVVVDWPITKGREAYVCQKNSRGTYVEVTDVPLAPPPKPYVEPNSITPLLIALGLAGAAAIGSLVWWSW